MNTSPTATAARLNMKRKALLYLRACMLDNPPQSDLIKLARLEAEIKLLEAYVCPAA